MVYPDNAFPESKLPQCWSDDVRMNALFAPFRLKAANPESWEMKMKFWSDMLRQWCRHKNDPIISAADAKVTFQRKGRTAACIDIVVEECFRNGQLSPVNKYQQILHNGPEGWIKWGARLAFKPAAIALTAVTSLLPAKQAIDNDGLPKASIDSTQRFVVECVVEEQANYLIEKYPAGEERCGTIDDLMLVSGWGGSREAFEILLGWLVSRGLAAKKGDIVKIADSPSSKLSAITEADTALATLSATGRRLADLADSLRRDLATAATDAKAALQLGNRVLAKNHLRRKHKLQDRVEKTESALDNVMELLHNVKNAHVNTAIVDTYRKSTEAMKKEMKDNRIDEDTVHDTMDELKEVLESYQEIEKAISTPTSDDYDNAELEEELQELLNTGREKRGEKREEEKREDKKSAVKTPPLNLPSPPLPRPRGRRVAEREDYVFDGEEQMLAELNELGLDDSRLRSDSPPRPSKQWYPPSSEFALDNSLEKLCQGFQELRTDDRIHPGQKLQVDHRAAPKLYSTDFQVQDHRLTDGVWLFNARDQNDNPRDSDLTTSTEYFNPESPGKSSGHFQMAPGGERVGVPWGKEEGGAEDNHDDLQRRLDNLRGFNL